MDAHSDAIVAAKAAPNRRLLCFHYDPHQLRRRRHQLSEQCSRSRYLGKELPTFKFELEKSEGRVMGGSYGKEATVAQLPISKGIAASRCAWSRG